MEPYIVKYMGSKRSMLRNGLGELLTNLVPTADNFFDLFCGSGVVAGYAAQKLSMPVCAGDLQQYAVALAAAQIEQTDSFDANLALEKWFNASSKWLKEVTKEISLPTELPETHASTETWRSAVFAAREYCAKLPDALPLAKAYGGYYFSPIQALAIDALRRSLPSEFKTPALAALIDAASNCAAAPGHTAQPFSTKDSALPHLAQAWSKDIVSASAILLERNATTIVKSRGRAVRSDALALTEELKENDIAFIDPPYSEVQYSRFYHVLEAIAAGTINEVKGVGRYPDLRFRPQSQFSLTSQSAEAFNNLMIGVAASGAQAIVTFPSGEASNGLSGQLVEEISSQYFYVRTRKISSLFSTLGGNSISRNARSSATELILHLEPR